MKLSIATLAAILLLFPFVKGAEDSTKPEAFPFHITSYGTAFGMQGDFEGQYRIYPRSIEVELTKADVRISTHCPYKGRRDFTALSFGLATHTPNGRWHMPIKSQKLFVGRIMNPGDEFSLGSLHFSIPIEETTDLSKHWLVVQLDDLVLDHPRGIPVEGFAYAHSCKDIFTRQQEELG